MIYLPDTNILIGIVTGRREYASLLREFIEQRHLLATCSIVVSEVYAGMRPSEEANTSALLESLEFLPVTYEISKRAGLMRRELAKKGRVLTVADATIAAVAMENQCVLVTENAKDFQISGLTVLVPKAS